MVRWWWYGPAVVAPLVLAALGLLRGPAEIRHAEWARMDLG